MIGGNPTPWARRAQVPSRSLESNFLSATAQRHAGENLAAVLSRRALALPPPIHMCDALSRNVPKLPQPLELILANCLTHGRRQFVDVLDHFPDQCRTVIETLGLVYRNDELARDQAMNPAERLAFHQAHSRPLLDGLHTWLCEQRDQRKVEPNSGLGQAIAYLLHHWQKLTVFLRVAGARSTTTSANGRSKRRSCTGRTRSSTRPSAAPKSATST